ncbi:hypothetical protein SAMN05421830_12049 [Desulfomicrobium norvegicum]|uniref:Uncharacterized protein n=1 Tax=Desulfomicrobium norvegicum (strain DSM 1741 / NCIMB 8310) TaxID=52561 RepID=A0A8G2F9G7_DESNO|nr:hypothetical protein [Desulfomicrobium norvegicum]SFM20547.1 hypothetical protein SAMN05421830_12049 [Desulfomicrobium norvegicum]
MLSYKKFKDIDIDNIFFDSLKLDYKEFEDWFVKKSDKFALVHSTVPGTIDGFLYLKIEDEAHEDIVPKLPKKQRIKLGTFKIDAHGTRLGERFIKKSLDFAIHSNIDELYITIFEKHAPLINLIQKYGFISHGTKIGPNGIEQVFIKKLSRYSADILKNYPNVDCSKNKFVLSIYPQWHTRLFPDSILNNENPQDIIQDVSHTNSIHKIYMCNMGGVEDLKRGDILCIYRTSDGGGPAHYRSVITTICTVEEISSIYAYKSEDEFIDKNVSYSVFDKTELSNLYRTKRFPKIIKFLYNTSMVKKINRKHLIENLNILSNYWGFFQLTNDHFNAITNAGQINERYFINKT